MCWRQYSNNELNAVSHRGIENLANISFMNKEMIIYTMPVLYIDVLKQSPTESYNDTKSKYRMHDK